MCNKVSVDLRKSLSLLMVLSALFLIAGAALLRIYSLVPFYLTLTTALAVVVILIVAHFINRGYTWAANTGIALAIISILTSALSPTHNSAVLNMFSSPLLAVLVLLEIFGFYVFPVLFLIIRAVKHKEFRGKKFS